MSYTKHNYQKGDELLASQLNEMDDQIELNEQTADILVEDLDEVSRQLSDETTGLDSKAPVIINTASGAIASFSDGANGMPIRKLVAQIEPVQDLHGYDHPWPGGGNENLWIPPEAQTYYGVDVTLSSDGGIILSGTPSTSVNLEVPITLKAGTYYLGDFSTGSFPIKDSAKFDISQTNLIVTNRGGGNRTATLTEDISTMLRIRLDGGFNYSVVVKPMLISGSSAPTTYSPYSNECPISGHTGADVTQRGKNLFNKDSAINGYWNPSGTFNPVRTLKTIYCRVTPNTTYTLSGVSSWDSLRLCYFNSLTPVTFTDRYTQNLTQFTTGADTVLIAFCPSASTFGTGEGVQLEKGSSVTSFEPYTGDQISVTFPTTIYGGEDEVIGGALVDECAHVDLSTLNWTYSSVTKCFTSSSLENVIKKPTTTSEVLKNLLCSIYKTVSSLQLQDNDFCISVSSGGNVFVKDSRYTDVASFISAVANADTIYPLATPVEYSLEGHDLTTLYGTNNIWCNTGDTEVTYPADTKLYIDGKLAEIQATILENIGG